MRRNKYNVTRVPGGWIYTFWNHSVFVPYCEDDSEIGKLPVGQTMSIKGPPPPPPPDPNDP